MPDIALQLTAGSFAFAAEIDAVLTTPPTGEAPYSIDVQADEGLTTSVLISLFTDGRADEVGADDPSDLRGWWGDQFGAIGCRLWQLQRQKITEETLSFAKAEAESALAWLVDEGIASRVVVSAARTGLNAVWLQIQIERPTDPTATYRFALNWAATLN